MRTVTLDILNEEAIKLLKKLEVLKLIKFRKDKTPSNEHTEQISLSDFSFSESRQTLKNYEGSLSEAVAEERRNEI